MATKSNIPSMTNYYLKMIIIIYLLLALSNCYLILPLNFMPVYKNEENTPSLIMRNLVYTKVYANLEVGTPKESIQIPIEFESNDFYISENAREKFLKYPDKWDEIKFFNSTNSKTCEKVEEEEYDGDNFDKSQYYKDIFYFNEKNVELEFYLPENIKTAESGGIGLELWPIYTMTNSTIDEKRTFLKKLKNNGLINEYYWSVFYNSKNYTDKNGFILLGPLPHNLNKDLGYYNKEYFDQDYLNYVFADIWVDRIKYRFQFDEVYAYKGNDKENKIIDKDLPMNSSRILNVELEYNFGGIQASNRFLPYFKKYFEEYITRGECFFDNFKVASTKYFFYCKNDKNLTEKIKENFPSFSFLSRDLNITFELNPDDLFVEEKDYVFLVMFFHFTTADLWIMGRPFLQKYQFIINPDRKIINFYSSLDKINPNTDSNSDSNSDSDKNSDKNSDKISDKNTNINNTEIKKTTLLLIIIVIVAVLIIIVLGFCLLKYYFKAKLLRKKRANELEEPYEYIEKKDQNNKEYLDPNAINE